MGGKWYKVAKIEAVKSLCSFISVTDSHHWTDVAKNTSDGPFQNKIAQLEISFAYSNERCVQYIQDRPFHVCLFRFIHTVWHTCENWKEQDPKCSSADGSHLSREYNNDIIKANLELVKVRQAQITRNKWGWLGRGGWPKLSSQGGGSKEPVYSSVCTLPPCMLGGIQWGHWISSLL